MTSFEPDYETGFEMSDVYLDNISSHSVRELDMGSQRLKRKSVKSTPRTFIETPTPLIKVKDSAPHFLDSKRKLFCRLTFPYILVCVFQLYFQWDDCRVSAEKVDHDSSEEVEYAGANLCIDPYAEFLNVCFFIAVQMTCYQVRKELMLRSPLIFSFVEDMKKRDDKKVQMKNVEEKGNVSVSSVKDMKEKDDKQIKITNVEEWGNVLSGRHERFGPWNIRGHVIFPLCTLLAIFLGFLVRGYLRKYGDSKQRACVQGAYTCGADNVYALSDASVIMIAVRYSFSWSIVAHAVMAAVYPLILVSLIVSSSLEERIGLWKQSDVSLREVQRISMHSSLYLSGDAFLLVMYTLSYAATGLLAQMFYIVLISSILVAVLLVPIVSAIIVLQDLKEKDLAIACKLEEDADKNFFGLLRAGFEERLQPGEVEKAESELEITIKYRTRVQGASVVPSSFALVKTYASSIFVGIVLPFVLSSLR